MRIAIDARWIFREISGIGTYTCELIRELARLDHDNEYLLIFRDPAVQARTLAETGAGKAANFRAVRVPYGVFSPLGQLRLPWLLRRERVEVFHSTNFMMPLFMGRGRNRPRCVVTIHDVIPLIFPDHAPRSKKSRAMGLYRRLMMLIGRRADRILTVSRASAQDIIAQLHIPPEHAGKVQAIYNGVSGRYSPLPDMPEKGPEAARKILYVGRFDPYKNLAVLIRAFAAARAQVKFPLTLVVAGAPDPRYPEAPQLARELGVNDAIDWRGYVTHDQLVSLYQECDVLAHPSRYEGFGLQILEAMASGLPVICSRAGALPEVAGDAAVLRDPDDLDGWAGAIAWVLGTPVQQQAMRRQGLAQAARFQWPETARAVLAAYRQAAAGTDR